MSDDETSSKRALMEISHSAVQATAMAYAVSKIGCVSERRKQSSPCGVSVLYCVPLLLSLTLQVDPNHSHVRLPHLDPTLLFVRSVSDLQSHSPSLGLRMKLKQACPHVS